MAGPVYVAVTLVSMLRRYWLVGTLETLVQVEPASVVHTTVPLSPTAQPWLVLVNDTELRSLPVCEVCDVQVVPPSVEAKIRPSWPTMKRPLLLPVLQAVSRSPLLNATAPRNHPLLCPVMTLPPR